LESTPHNQELYISEEEECLKEACGNFEKGRKLGHVQVTAEA
jgi:hypothetical protein